MAAAYNFDEGTGTTVTDISPSGTSGRVVGASWTNQGKYGNALAFNGASSYVDLGNPAALQLTGSMTVEAWVKPAGNYGYIVTKADKSSGWQLRARSRTFAFAIGSEGKQVLRYSRTTQALNTWYHVAGVYNAAAQTLDIYVNGILDNGALRGTIPQSQSDSSVNVNVGRRSDGSYFSGTVDEVRVYKRALSRAEIQSDMNTPLGTPSTSPTPVTVSISPTSASLQTGSTRQFTASVSGTTNTAVTWSASGGSVSSSGLYTAPATSGTYTVRATSVADTAKYSSATVTVSSATSYLLSISPSSLSFGSVVVGNSSSKTVTLSNTGAGSVQVTAANFTGGVFGASGFSLPLTISAGTQKAVTVVFQPDTSGPFSGSVSFVSNATNSPAVATLSGSGTAPMPHAVDLTWNPSTTPGIGYFVYRGSSSAGPYTKLNGTSVPATDYTDSTVQSGTTYYYVVTAVDGNGGESAYSNVAVAAVPTP